ncbi:MAG: hypothetical protein QOF03_408 [Alphaproteobacteria bacterium]|jgi:hypothetical protein|nr:hypothetical protein [Alphaproteobacteria bacterium]
MTKDGHPNRRAISAGLVAAGALAVSRPAQSAAPPAADKAKAYAALPDWSGVWMGVGTTLFEQKAGAASLNANNPNARDFPPYKPEWEAAYTRFLTDVVKQEKFSDPLSLGYPGGMIRMMSPARGLQFVLRPEQVWIIYERPDVRYIYTDGRPFPPKDELWPTFEGYSIGHWEGDTLVVETVSLRGGVPIDRTGAALSDEAHVIERIRKTDDKTLQSDITIEDPVAFTAPWKVTRRYTNRREQYPRMENVSSLENQRNPVVNGETKIILAGDSDPSSPYPPDIRPFALAKFPFPR